MFKFIFYGVYMKHFPNIIESWGGEGVEKGFIGDIFISGRVKRLKDEVKNQKSRVGTIRAEE